MGIIIRCKHGAKEIKRARKILHDFGIVSYEEHNYEEYIGIEIFLENKNLSNFLSSKYYIDGFIKTD